MGELVAGRLPAGDVDWLHRLVSEWQLLADLSFADLVLWVADGADTLWAVAQIRPTTGPTAHQDDLVGAAVAAADRPQLVAALRDGRICREGDPVWTGDLPVREEAIPVRHDARVVAVVGRETNLSAARTPSRLELAYLSAADDLAQMVAEGRFPYPSAPAGDAAAPRVGDGLIRLDADGRVSFASPNALSAYRRLGYSGDLTGGSLHELTVGLAGAPLPAATPRSPGEPLSAVTSGRSPGLAEVERAGAVVVLRTIPLRPGGVHIGALVLVHDVSELRRRDRALTTKDAMIREIHHRVKNNLQTVAALLRLQGRRLDSAEARDALEESVRRVSAIALVHETLSVTPDEAVDFDAVADRVVAMVLDVAGEPGRVAVRRSGSFGTLPASVATSLAMVLTELVQNAAEHAFAAGPGTVTLDVRRSPDALALRVVDDGAGLAPGFTLEARGRLGLSIVRTLVEGELGGRLELRAGAPGGTEARVELPLG